MKTPKYKFRYPGTNFFEEDQQEIFFGRQLESQELIHAIKAHDVFVIFANSGIGKTSLLNACLIPTLKKENFIPIRFRFQDTGITPLQEIRSNLEDYMKSTTDPEQKLWYQYKACDFGDAIPLFIFDQFEEFFNHSKPDRDRCISEVADLINNYLPPYIIKEMKRKFREEDPTAEDLEFYSPVNQRVLFLIRSDRLNLLDELSTDIPSILRNRFHLKPLTVKQAEEAILNPARLTGDHFATPPIHLEAVYQQMSQYLKNDEEEVESFQLQILCQELEKRVIAEHTDLVEKNKQAPIDSEELAQKIKDALTITQEELGGEEGMSNIVQNYYANRIESIADKRSRDKAVRLLEEELVVDKRRISLPESYLNKKEYPSQLLDFLVDNTRLIRVDRIKNQRFFEISHDRLLPPILASLQVRQQKEEEEKRMAKLVEERNRHEEMARKLQDDFDKEMHRNRVLRRYFRAVVILAIALIGFIIYANNLRVRSKLGNVTDWIEKEEYGKADSVLNYEASVKGINSLLNLFFMKDYKKLHDSIQLNEDKKSRFDTLVKNAESMRALGGENLPMAYYSYKSAGMVGFQPADKTRDIHYQLRLLAPQMAESFTKYVDRAEAFYQSEASFGIIKDSADILNAINVADELHVALRDYYKQDLDTTDIHFKKFKSLKRKMGL